jgi:hypothetical protein
MIEYVAAANAAYKIIKTAVQNGRELTSVGKAIGDFTLAQDKLRSQGHAKKNSIWSAFKGTKDENTIEEFMALEKIREQEEELKKLMIYVGRPGLHQDYVRFCVEARKNKQKAEADRKKQIADFWKSCEEIFLWFGIMLIVGCITVFFVWLSMKQGWIS